MADGSDAAVPSVAESDGLARSRCRRQKRENVGRSAALDKLKRRECNKYELSDSASDALYELVDESEYSRRVQERLQDDWIVDDGAGEYVEDGREIFDDDIVDDGRKRVQRSKDKRSAIKRVSDPSQAKKNNLRDMLLQMPANKKIKREVKLDEDDDLQSIIQGIKESPSLVSATPSGGQNRHSLQTKCAQIGRSVAPLSLTPRTPFARQDCAAGSRGVMSSRSPHPLHSLTASGSLVQPPPSSSAARADDVISPPPDAPPSPPIKQEADVKAFNDDEDVFDDISCEAADLPSAGDAAAASHLSVLADIKSSEDELQRGGGAGVTDVWTRTARSLQQQGAAAAASTIAPPLIDSNTLPLEEDESVGEKVFRFFWLDAFADNNSAGAVYLFGRAELPVCGASTGGAAANTVTCCVRLDDIPRRIFLLPRVKRLNLSSLQEGDDVTLKDVYDEFSAVVAARHKIAEFRSKVTSRKYAFQLAGVPDEADYLEVIYSAKFRALPTDLRGETFSHVFGANTSWLEHVLLGARLRGPSWLRIRQARTSSTRFSHCSLEVCASWSDQQGVLLSPCQSSPPPLTVLTLCTRTAVSQQRRQNELVAIAALVHRQYRLDRPAPSPLFQEHFCALTRPSDAVWPFDLDRHLTSYTGTSVRKCANEKALISLFLAKMNKLDPDIVLGHNVYGFDLDILLSRCRLLKLNNWSLLGRLRRSADVLFKSRSSDDWLKRSVMCGRLLCDSFLSAKELTRQKSYDLPELCRTVLHLPESEVVHVSSDAVAAMFSSSSSVLHLVSSSMQEAHNTMRVVAELNALPLALQITRLAGNLMSRTLLGGRAERNEFLLLHAFTERNFIPPDKQYSKRKASLEESCHLAAEDGTAGGGAEDAEAAVKGRRKAKYGGGLVLEPRRGFYDQYILLMDFNSLYPSIIQEYNICFTTLPRAAAINPQGEDGEEEVLPDLPDSSLETGVLPAEIKKLVERRREVKKLMKNQSLSSDELTQLDVRQKALKLTANSMYGCLGFESSRFYARHLAALITSKGRDILMQTKSLVEKMDLEVIYGDTDSIMINSRLLNYDKVMELGREIKREVNKLYRLLELDIDGLYRYMLLLKKKKYAAVAATRAPSGPEGGPGVISFTRELKGLDIVRRDWCKLAADTGLYVIDQIFSGLDHDEKLEKIHAHLEAVRDRLKAGQVAIADLAVTKELKKNPEEYADKKGQAHVNVALRVNTKAARKLRRGDTVQYVICQDGSGCEAMQRAYSVEEVRRSLAAQLSSAAKSSTTTSSSSDVSDNNNNNNSSSEKAGVSGSLTIDVEYYLANQVHPVVSRLLEPVECTDSGRVAECLGLDASRYRQSAGGAERGAGGADGDHSRLGRATSAANRFVGCQPLVVRCVECHQPQKFADSPLDGASGGVLSLSRCQTEGCGAAPLHYLPLLVNSLRLQSQQFIRQYLLRKLCCEDPCCTNETVALPFQFESGYPVCDLCHRALLIPKYDERQLHSQLCYFQHLFDLDATVSRLDAKQKQLLKRSPDYDALQRAYHTLYEESHKSLSLSNYSRVDLSVLFRDMTVVPACQSKQTPAQQ